MLFFSTGEAIDTLEVSGNVLAAADLEPVKGMMVGLHADLSDSALSRNRLTVYPVLIAEGVLPSAVSHLVNIISLV